MPITKLTPENNYPYLQDRLEALEHAVPEAFADGKVNWDTLREVIGEDLEEGSCEEYFGLNWPGKREARKRTATPSRAALVPAPGEGVNEDNTENLFIEGDNLEVLKLLQKSYAGKIKMIYIDPPYNTGNDFIYNDNFTDPLEAYLDYTGSRGESGELLTTNTRADGRFHSKWLNMMYPRLILARQLLREDGVIFISIDDNEVFNLRMLMNEVFGENCIEQYVWDVREDGNMPKTARGTVRKEHEYIIAGYKSADSKLLYRYMSYKYAGNEGWSNPDNDPRGPWMSGNISRGSGEGSGGSKSFTIVNPQGIEFFRDWSIGKDEYDVLLNDNRIYFADNGKGVPRKNIFKNELAESIQSSIFEGLQSSQSGKKEIQDLLGEIDFSYPKPVNLIKRILQISTQENDIVVDFFSGSSTTAHAVLDLNNEEKSDRKFIMIQLPEKTSEARFETIAEIGKERIRRAIEKIQELKIVESKNNPLFISEPQISKFGFKVYKHFLSNFKQWKPSQEENAKTLTPLFDNLSDPLVPGWKKEDLLSEILLLEGFPLTSKITYLEDHLQNEVYQVRATDFCAHDLFVCLDENIQPSTVELLTMEKEDIFICLDSALSDELKARLQDQFNVHVI